MEYPTAVGMADRTVENLVHHLECLMALNLANQRGVALALDSTMRWVEVKVKCLDDLM